MKLEKCSTCSHLVKMSSAMLLGESPPIYHPTSKGLGSEEGAEAQTTFRCHSKKLLMSFRDGQRANDLGSQDRRIRLPAL